MNTVPKTIKVALLSYNGVDELDLFGAYSVLKKAADVTPEEYQPDIDIYLASTSNETIGSSGIRFRTTNNLEQIISASAVVIPGGKGASEAAKDERIISLLVKAFENGSTLYGICTGSLLIAATGKASHSSLAIHHNKRQMLSDHPLIHIKTGLVRDGRIITIGGDMQPSLKSIDLAFAILTDIAPYTISPVSLRMEVIPGRGVSTYEAISGGQQ
ncbi:DJ-1/PfpI family protein [Sodalis sp. C49]|uniref:DJ-1/PfpI family protein n=1 Tax=Sodalis sp. C49 TaxID=3228929 RepID=UPI003965A6ED